MAMWARILLAVLLTTHQSLDVWLVLPGAQVGPITAATHRNDLERIFGKGNVKDVMRSMGGDQEEVPATLIYSGDASKEITIFWIPVREDERKVRRRATVGWVNLCGTPKNPCRWHLAEGISLGTSLKQLEGINGKPFDLYGFGWDYSGTVSDWRGGNLARLRSCQPVAVRLDVAGAITAEQSADYEHVEGDRTMPSSDPAMQRLNPTVYQITVSLQKHQPCAPGAATER